VTSKSSEVRGEPPIFRLKVPAFRMKNEQGLIPFGDAIAYSLGYLLAYLRREKQTLLTFPRIGARTEINLLVTHGLAGSMSTRGNEGEHFLTRHRKKRGDH